MIFNIIADISDDMLECRYVGMVHRKFSIKVPSEFTCYEYVGTLVRYINAPLDI